MKYLIGLVTIAVFTSAVQSTSFSYSSQSKWPGVCVRGNTGRQSPININTAKVKPYCYRNTLLRLNPSYFSPVDGTFVNNGHSVQFTPVKGTVARMTTPFGNYKLLQFHFHWGRRSGQGSEHRVNGVAAEFEVHFVHKNVVKTSPNAGNALAVLAIRGRVSPNLATTGIFSTLNPSKISKVNSPISVKGINMSELFPNNFDYYHYEGSLTTPPCSETVQWFVLKNTISVPGSYLKSLRKIDNGHGHPLTNNFRDTQPLNGRKVYLIAVSV